MQNNLKRIEYDEIKNLVKKYTKTYIGKNLLDEMLPDYNKDRVISNLEKTNCAFSLINSFQSIPIDYFDNIDVFIKTLDSGSGLSAKALLEIAKVLKMSEEVHDYYFKNRDSLEGDFSSIENYFSNLFYNKDLEKRITDAIIDETSIADNASSKLATLRRNRRSLEQQIKEKLNKFIHSSTYSKYLMDNLVTLRNDRYVVPVKAEYKSQIKGSVLDMSSTGTTLFIEPAVIFDLNNDINNIKLEEEIEIEKILLGLSLNLMPYTNQIKNNVQILGNLDFIFAKAKYSMEINGIIPKINDNKLVVLDKARHPLIDKNKVVPINVSIGNDYNNLIISGPNTGGKTVTLKTVGLLLAMAYSGIMIPANESSEIYVFDNIFVDIGDEQSIEENLSTFSSHMVNIKEITQNATDKSIILIDELGSGTDPEEGASLAIAILEYFNSIGATTICTTHYKELKNYALVTPCFKTASSDFDIENLRPTYKLIIGVPGKSNAIAISKKLGIDDIIIENAKSKIDNDSVHIEDLLKEIYLEKEELDKKLDEANKNLEQAKLLTKNLKRDNQKLDEEAEAIISKAKKEAFEILTDAKEEASDLIRELNNPKVNSKDANNIRNKLNDSIKNIYKDVKKKKDPNEVIDINELSIGDEVFVNSLELNGNIVNIKNNKEVIVRIGNFDQLIKLNDIDLIRKASSIKPIKENKVDSSNKLSSMKAKEIASEINLIGLTVDEAVSILDKYIDDSVLAKIDEIRIVHGKGTGKLREGIQRYLKSNNRIESFRIGGYFEGQMGVTIAKIKRD
jgi:DNA mismatch repair protein MutS2